MQLALSVATVLAVALAAGAAEPQQPLVSFAQDFDIKSVGTQDAKVSLAGASLRVDTAHREPWPGITLKAPGGRWDLAQFELVAVDVKNVGLSEVSVHLRVDNEGADGVRNCMTGVVAVKPGQTDTLRIAFRRKLFSLGDRKLFGMRGYPDGSGEGTIDPSRITQLILFIARPGQDHSFEVSNIRAAGAYTPPAAVPSGPAFFPFIDTFGQYIHKDWPGKTHSMEELAQRRDAEIKNLAEKPGPADWDKYGGWAAGPQLKGAGFFRAEKYNGKWWLVDPDGRLFFSHGVDCVGSTSYTPTDERADWYADFPGDKPEFALFIRSQFALHGHYAGKSPKCFSFAAANLVRKYGADWRQRSREVAHLRLRSWGLNTIANWSDESLALMRKTPYTATLGVSSKKIEGSSGYWGKFADVFDPDFRDQARKSMARMAGKSAGDPWCIGFFVDNEIAWGDDESALGLGAIISPPEQAAKKVFVEDLKAKYGTIDKLNEAWGTNHESWDALLASRAAPDKAKARTDLQAFTTRICEQYFKVVRDAVKEIAPNQLYLGCRFAWVNPRAVAASVKFCDVVSFNLYKPSVAEFKVPGNADVPLIIGEFHFGALDRGMFHTGLVPVKDQAARAAAYKGYVMGALRHPNFVGTHWFEYQDEPTTGRSYDEENYQIGFVDTVDTPYPELVQAARDVGYTMYKP